MTDVGEGMANQRQHPRTQMKAQIRIWHQSFGDILAYTRDLSDGGFFVEHPLMGELSNGDEVTGQVQGMPFEAPVLRMQVQRAVPGEGAGMAFLGEADEVSDARTSATAAPAG